MASSNSSIFGTRKLRVSKRLIREALDAAEIEFLWCQRVVGALSGYHVETITGEDVVDFQVRLYRAIAPLEKVYRAIKQEEKRLIREKSRFKIAWFGRRMAQLSTYTKQMREGLQLGRAIGDGFAWFFYERDPHLIDEHLKHQPQLLFPPDLGAAGERLIVENLRGVDGKILIYHGITSILRIGDFSFVNMDTMRVACLVELKTSRIDSHRINISMSMIAGAKDQIPVFPKSGGELPPMPAPPLTGVMQARFDRQKKVMQDSIVRARDAKADLTINNSSSFHYRALEDVVRRSHSRGFSYVQAGDGLLICAWRAPQPTWLGASSSKNVVKQMSKLAEDVPEWATKILIPGSEWNSISVGGLGGDDSLIMRSGSLPFFAWPVDPGVLADIGFERVTVTTLYNAAHLIQRLHDRGYAVEVDEKGRLKKAHRTTGAKLLELQNYDYFFKLVQWSLMTEDAVLTMIDETIKSIDSVTEDNHPARIEFRPVIRRSSAR